MENKACILLSRSEFKAPEGAEKGVDPNSYPLHVLLDGLCASFSSYHIFLVKVGIRKCFEDPLELETAVSKCHFCSLLCLKRGRKGKKSVCICSLPYLFYKTLSQSQNKSLKGI